ncbi:DNA-binding response regulator, OmpR family, contains REC and winged-helix (wHTH) domain [Muriicola jejuensis]|uniref:Response regulator n=1 Tax=Muriicola jejuensis TaxID=504488 RepID=A0A6P0U7Y6_9FLAO|nr:response regulator transcription factor [Muriicola jejuensis]NER09247.1 response regulator [Muriicola jejuensis]SMP09987.1 DNA-binding response regulator, OmpR family, contains REC and winged-helix (wHTH) domain [Muriicola jejuensis]
MADNLPKIMLVEDDTSLGYLLTEYLQLKGFKVFWASGGKKAIEKLEQEEYDLVILDIMMPEMDGFTLASTIKSRYPDLPFIFLTAKSLKVDVLKAFSLGAVDYLKKPIDEEELVVRIKALLSHIKGADPAEEEKPNDIRQLGKYTFNPLNQELHFKDEVIHLTSRENELLTFLSSRINKLSAHKDILMALWGSHDYFKQKSLNVFITHLRKYLEKDEDIRIENVHGQGFILRVRQAGN